MKKGSAWTGGPAFPTLTKVRVTGDNDAERVCSGPTGLTIRDYFASSAFPIFGELVFRLEAHEVAKQLGILKDYNEGKCDRTDEADRRRALDLVAIRSYECADAMIRASGRVAPGTGAQE